MNVPISDIRVGRRMRPLREDALSALMASISLLGLQTPITVASGVTKREGEADGVAFDLIAGHHRLEACRRLGWEEIEASVVMMTDRQKRLWEIDENLCRADLTELERAEHLAERKGLYEEEHPETRHGENRSPSGEFRHTDTAPFSEDTAAKTGMAERTVRQAVRRATKIDKKVRDSIRANPKIADSGVELDALASLDKEQQRQAVKMVESGKVETVREAKAQIVPPKPKPPVTRTSEHAQEFPDDGPVRDDGASDAPGTEADDFDESEEFYDSDPEAPRQIAEHDPTVLADPVEAEPEAADAPTPSAVTPVTSAHPASRPPREGMVAVWIDPNDPWSKWRVARSLMLAFEREFDAASVALEDLDPMSREDAHFHSEWAMKYEDTLPLRSSDVVE